MNKQGQPPGAADLPIPGHMAQRLAGWSASARLYPVFGPTWFRYRLRSFLLPVILLTLVLAAVLLLAPKALQDQRIWQPVLAIWLMVLLSLFVGRWLAVIVRRQGWLPKREAAGVTLALLAGLALSSLLIPYTRSGKSAGSSMVVGVDAGSGPGAARQALAAGGESAPQRIVNTGAWLLLLLWWGGGYDLVLYFRQRRMLAETRMLEQMERYKNERNQVEMRLSVLASQIEPHFLFNTLSGVRAAILSDPARGVAIIDHLVDYLRLTIPQIRADGSYLFVDLRSQLESVRAYLGVMHMRLPRLSFSVDCAPDLLDAAVPPLMLISLVENAVKHGVELKKGPAQIQVGAARVAHDSERMVLRVQDDGLGFSGAGSGSGIGLANIRERLQHLYGDAATLSLNTGARGGVEALIVLPVRPLPAPQPTRSGT
jgi:hypothetical protein